MKHKNQSKKKWCGSLHPGDGRREKGNECKTCLRYEVGAGQARGWCSQLRMHVEPDSACILYVKSPIDQPQPTQAEPHDPQ